MDLPHRGHKMALAGQPSLVRPPEEQQSEKKKNTIEMHASKSARRSSWLLPSNPSDDRSVGRVGRTISNSLAAQGPLPSGTGRVLLK